AGPGVDISPDQVERIDVETAQQMFDAATDHFHRADIAVMAAAVADYRPTNAADQKIKKSEEALNLNLVRNPDILSTLGNNRVNTSQFVVGFALETENALEHARLKLEKKNADMIVLNTLADEGAGFGHNTNKVTLLTKSNKITSFELKSKAEVARDIIQTIVEEFGA
ncbi:MAG: phosphopantothenoylcysteine decarboxylase, partial [Flavobacteriales bacterium]|nr:phosphopantothenoylcysteine decarboxylase [Flavobacteriales bacterium]